VLTALFHDPAAASGLFPAEPDLDFILAQYRDLAALARFSWTPFLSNPKLERRLHRIPSPTLVACPSDDRLISTAHGRRFAELIPRARFAEIGDCGHAMYFERPAEFADLVAAFLGEPGGEQRQEGS
jgi:pimeloyl-ACP methyl ester carboxylesterase